MGSREWGETDPRLIALLERQLARIGDRDPARRVRVLATLTMELYSDETAVRGWGYANEALDIARRLGQPEELGIAVSAYLFSAGELTEHVPQLRAILDEMLQRSQRDLTPQVEATALAVLDGQQSNQPIGWITETDIAAAMAQGKDLNKTRIRDLIARGHASFARL